MYRRLADKVIFKGDFGVGEKTISVFFTLNKF